MDGMIEKELREQLDAAIMERFEALLGIVNGMADYLAEKGDTSGLAVLTSLIDEAQGRIHAV